MAHSRKLNCIDFIRYLTVSYETFFEMRSGRGWPGTLKSRLHVSETIEKRPLGTGLGRGFPAILEGNTVGHDKTITGNLQGRYAWCVSWTSTAQHTRLYQTRFHWLRVEEHGVGLRATAASPGSSN